MTQKERSRKHYLANKALYKRRAKEWAELNPKRRKAIKNSHRLRKAYQLTPEQKRRMHKDQSGLCANPACVREAIHIDHDHATNKVRGLLCMHCNVTLGNMNDDPNMLLGLVSYLRETKSKG